MLAHATRGYPPDAMDLDELATTASGDPIAAQRLFLHARDELDRYLRRYFWPLGDELDDVLQNTLAVLHRKLAQFVPNGPRSFVRWARGMARFEAKEAMRKRRRRGDLQVRAAARTVGSPGTGLSSRILKRQRLALVREQVGSLSPSHRRVLEDELAGGDAEAYAERERLAVATVRTTRWLARKRLQSLVLARLEQEAGPKLERRTPSSSTQPSA